MGYSVNKKDQYQDVEINLKKMYGFQIKPRNQVHYDGVTVNNMIIIKPSFVEKVLKRKTKKKLEQYLKFLIELLEDEDNTDPGKIAHALNDLERYKRLVANNYRIYLDQLYYDLLLKKIEVIEKELKVRKMYLDMTYQAMMQNSYQENLEEKSRKSR